MVEIFDVRSVSSISVSLTAVFSGFCIAAVDPVVTRLMLMLSPDSGSCSGSGIDIGIDRKPWQY